MKSKMFHRKKSLSPPGTFDFPYQPYDIQSSFMHSLYSVIEHSKIGIFESPTGELNAYDIESESNDIWKTLIGIFFS